MKYIQTLNIERFPIVVGKLVAIITDVRRHGEEPVLWRWNSDILSIFDPNLENLPEEFLGIPIDPITSISHLLAEPTHSISLIFI